MKRRRDGLQRRDAILDAALRCFARSGIMSVGIEAIRREAGASPSSVYNLFANIHEIVVALLLRCFQRLFAHLCAEVLETEGARAAVMTLVEAHIAWMLEHPDEGRFIYQATGLDLARETSDTVSNQKAEWLQPIALHIAPMVHAGELPPWSILQLDVVLLGPSHEACRRYLAGAPLDPAWMREALPGLAWSALQGT